MEIDKHKKDPGSQDSNVPTSFIRKARPQYLNGAVRLGQYIFLGPPLLPSQNQSLKKLESIVATDGQESSQNQDCPRGIVLHVKPFRNEQ